MIDKAKNTRIIITVPIKIKEQIIEKATEDNRSMTNYVLNLILKDLNGKTTRD